MTAISVKRNLLALFLLVLIVPAAIACSSKKKSQAPAGGATPVGVAATPTPQELLDAAIKSTKALNAFHFTLTHENGSTPIAQGIQMKKADGDFVKPDRFKATVNGTAAGGFAIDAKVINVGDKVWIALIGNRYVPLQNGVAASAILDPNNGVLKALRGVKNPTYTGTDKINGVDTTIVSGTIDAGDLTAIDSEAQAGKSVQGRVWIGTSDHRLYRLRIEGPLNDQEPANIARQIDLSQFDEGIDIQPPA